MTRDQWWARAGNGDAKTAPPVRAGRWNLDATTIQRWRKPVLLGLAVLNFVIIARVLAWPDWRGVPDWRLWANLPASHYADPLYRYSPIAAWILSPLAIALGPVGFSVAHFAVLLALPRKVGLIVALSFPFWFDLLWGNVFTLAFVAAWWAVRGNRVGVLVFLVLTLLMPRPVQFPLALWLLWREPWVRVPFAVVFALHLGVVAWSGLGPEWFARLMMSGGNEAAMAYNFGPTRFFGTAWLVVGVPLALYLFRRHPAWAGLALSPYLLGQYWLMAAVMAEREEPPLRASRSGGSARPVVSLGSDRVAVDVRDRSAGAGC